MSTLHPTLEVSRDRGPVADYDSEPTEMAFGHDTFAGTDSFEPNGFCQGCGGVGWVTWTDRTEGPCPACKGNDDNPVNS